MRSSRLNIHFGEKHIKNVLARFEIENLATTLLYVVAKFFIKGRVNQQVQHYGIFLKKHSAGVRKLSFSLGLALIFFLILAIFPSVTVLMSVPLGIYCLISLFPFSMAPFCHAQ